MNSWKFLLLIWLTAVLPAMAEDIAAPEPQHGSISGTVLDVYGDLIPGALVTLQCPSPCVNQTATANDNAAFDFRDLKFGVPYQVHVSVNGFEDWNSPAIAPHCGSFLFLRAGNQAQDRRRVDLGYGLCFHGPDCNGTGRARRASTGSWIHSQFLCGVRLSKRRTTYYKAEVSNGDEGLGRSSYPGGRSIHGRRQTGCAHPRLCSGRQRIWPARGRRGCQRIQRHSDRGRNPSTRFCTRIHATSIRAQERQDRAWVMPWPAHSCARATTAGGSRITRAWEATSRRALS